MGDFFKIKLEDIIISGVTHNPYSKHEYIVYIDKNNLIRVNTDYREIETGIYNCCKHYDRPLCNSIDEFRALTILDIERQAYNSWMDGAR